jgi:hypothetical protein
MLLTRCLDAETINAVVNSPDIRPFVGPGADPLDLSDAVAIPEHLFLIGEHGGFSLAWSAPGVREVHTFIKREGRGKWAREAAAEGIAYARDHGTRMLWTKCPTARPYVALYAAAMGMEPTGETIETFGEPYDVYKMELQPCQ